MNDVAMQDEDVDGEFNSDDYASFISFLDSGDIPHGYPVKAESRFPQGQGQPFFSIATQQPTFSQPPPPSFVTPQPPQPQMPPQPSFFTFSTSTTTSAPPPSSSSASSQFFTSPMPTTTYQQTPPSTPPSSTFFGVSQPSPQHQQALYQQQQLLLRQQQELQRQQMQQMQQLPPPPSPVSSSSSPPPPSPNDLSMPQTQLPQITATNLEQCQQLLNEIYQWEQRQKEQLEQIRQFQKQLMMRPQKEGFDMLQTQHQQLKGQILQELRTLTALFQQVILPPADIQKVIALLQDLKVQQVQLELFQHELNRLTLSPQQVQLQQPLCALVIAEQPLPMVITKGKQLEDDPIVVQLLTGASVEVQSYSKVKVAMVCDNQQVKSTTSKIIENDTQALDTFRRQAKFYLKFAVGTRKNPVRLKFGIQLQIQQNGGGSQTVTVESNASRSFIVITNECQWEEAEGILLKKDAFGDQMEVTWPQFANVLQRHFLRASRQDLVKPTRYLTVFDFEYLRDKFFPGQTVINQKGYDNFWTWFGKGVQKLRYQRHICPLWQTGLIYGFLTREAVEETLMHEEVGTFLIRFAERHPGLFAVGYKTEDKDITKSVHHYLIRPEDTGTKKTLPDFLADCSAFLYLLQVTPEIDNGKPKLRKFSRDVALQPYYSKKSSITDAQGYDDSLPAHQMARYNF